MHRTLKRVPLDFDWPIGTIWMGYDRTTVYPDHSVPNLKCFGLTKQGQPKHPLYLKSSAALQNLK